MSDNLFPDEPKPKRKKKLQHQVLDYLRTGEIITEEIYRNEIGGKSVSAAIHNLKMRGHFEKGEFIINEKVKDSEGFLVPGYRLAKETRLVDFPQKEQELDPTSLSEQVGDISMEMLGLESYPLGSYMDEPDNEPDPERLDSIPEVSSIMVGVRGTQPELVVMFKGDFKPLRHVMTHMEVRYLMTNLESFSPKKREE